MRFQPGERTYIIAEIGANHNGDLGLARKMVRNAKELGCDCAKFQSWDVGLFSQVVYDQNYFLADDYRNRTDYTLKEIVAEFALSPDELSELSEYCRKLGIDFASTPFSPDQLRHLVELDVPFIKIASMDLNNDSLLRLAAETGRPILLSTGFGTLTEIDHAIRTIEDAGNRDIVVLHCISLYPPADEQVNLNNMDMLRQAFGYPVGFSDHTLGTEISLAAIAKGAVVLEKHFTLDKEMEGWDHKISADPGEMAVLVKGARRIHAALGSARRTVSREERERRRAYRRSMVSARDIEAGQVITPEDLTAKRPGTGIEPNMAPLLVGMVAARDIPSDTVIQLTDLQIKPGA